MNATPLKRFSSCLEVLPLQALGMLFAWKILVPKLPTGAGLVFANFFHGGLFIFFLLGLVFFHSFVNVKSILVRLVPYVVFFGLVPFWHRTMPHNIIESAPSLLIDTWLAKYYAMIVAIAGTLVFVDISRLLNSFGSKLVNVSMCYIGAASLGIYAIHFYFVSFKPPVIAAIFMSLLIYQTVLFIPIVRKILFGK